MPECVTLNQRCRADHTPFPCAVNAKAPHRAGLSGQIRLSLTERLDHTLSILSITNRITYQHDTTAANTSETIIIINNNDHTINTASTEPAAGNRRITYSETNILHQSHSAARNAQTVPQNSPKTNVDIIKNGIFCLHQSSFTRTRRHATNVAMSTAPR